MKLSTFEKIMYKAIAIGCYITHKLFTLSLVQYFYDMFNPDTKVYKAWGKVFKFICILILTLIILQLITKI